MISQSMKNLLPLSLDINKPTTTVCNDNNFVFNGVLFDTETLSALQEVFSPSQDITDTRGSKSASVKFMITMKDEADLRKLGYNKAQIDALKPQEAADILKV